MSHPFGNLLSQYLHRRHGLSQARLAAGILQAPSIISEMCKGQRLTGVQARERVLQIIEWLREQGVLTTIDANALLEAAGMAPLRESDPVEATLLRQLQSTTQSSGQSVVMPGTARPSSTSAQTNLPIPLTDLIGRKHELAEIKTAIAAHRLVTLTGPGGCGKTRLALEIAHTLVPQFAHGVFFVNLTPIQNPTLVLPIIAHTLRLQETPEQSLEESLKNFLHERQILLLLDNFEQVVTAASRLAELHQYAPGLTLLVTSRMRLQLRGEKQLDVPPLALPDHAASLEGIAQAEAVQLFVARVQDVQPTFVLSEHNVVPVAELCRRLDGLPLALELAAVRCRVLSPAALLARLVEPLTLLTRGARDLPDRQQTLRATIAWSVALLTPAEQTLFQQLAVFRGSFSLESVTAICQAMGNLIGAEDVLEGLTVLVEHHLVRSTALDYAGASRFTMLETLRSYAHERLMVSGEAESLRRQHAGYYLSQAEEINSQLGGPQQGKLLAHLEEEIDNLRVAMAWSLEEPSQVDRVELGLRIADALWDFWDWSGRFSEAWDWLRALLALPGAAAPTVARANALRMACLLVPDEAQKRLFVDESVALLRMLGDRTLLGWSLHVLGVMMAENDPDAATRTLQESLVLFRAVGNQEGISTILGELGKLAWWSRHDLVQATALFAEQLAVSREAGNQSRVADSLRRLAYIALAQGDYNRAETLYHECLTLFRELGMQGGRLASALISLSEVAQTQGDYLRSETLYSESLALYRKAGPLYLRSIAYALRHGADLALHAGDLTGAQKLLVESLQTYQKVVKSGKGTFRFRQEVAKVVAVAAKLAIGQYDLVRAARLFAAAEVLYCTHPAANVQQLLPNWQAYEQAKATAHTHLGEAAFAAEWTAGEQLVNQPDQVLETLFLSALPVSDVMSHEEFPQN